jgi:DNA repair exonuclease SbcCD ATPase subunit
MKIYTAGYRAKNREKRLAKQKEYAKKNPEKIKDLNLRANYGLTYDSYIQMLAEQNGKCKICGRSDSGHVNSKWLAVDHDHATGKIRGLLCQPCNRGIGLLRDCPDTLAAAIIYLKESA